MDQGPLGLRRREFLRRSGLTLVTVGASPALFAACGGSDKNASTADAGAASTAAAPATSTATTGPKPGIQGDGKVGGTMDFLSWEGYDLPDPMKEWKTTNNVELKPTYIATHDDIQAKLIAAKGKGGYDIITYYQGYKPLYRELELLEPLDPDQVPNMKNLYPYFQGDQGNFWIEPDGTRTGVPWDYGAIGITWDDAVLPGGLKSWSDLLDPKFKGKVGAVDDPQGNLALVCHILGKQPDKLPKELAGHPADQGLPDRDVGADDGRLGVVRRYDPEAGLRRHRRVLDGLGRDEHVRRRQGHEDGRRRCCRRRARTGSPTRGRSRPAPTTSRRSTRG